MADCNLWWGERNQVCSNFFLRLLGMQQRMGYVAMELNDPVPETFISDQGFLLQVGSRLALEKKVNWIWIQKG